MSEGARVEVVYDRLGEIARAFPEASSAILGKAAHDCEALAKQRAPVDTGRLKNSIATHGAALDWEVATDVSYAIYQEFGTRYMRAHPFMVPAADAAGASMVEAFRAIEARL